jgi:hypothetical protein
VNDNVLDTYSEPVVNQPIIDDFLNSAHVVGTSLRAKVLDDDMV